MSVTPYEKELADRPRLVGWNLVRPQHFRSRRPRRRSSYSAQAAERGDFAARLCPLRSGSPTCRTLSHALHAQGDALPEDDVRTIGIACSSCPGPCKCVLSKSWRLSSLLGRPSFGTWTPHGSMLALAVDADAAPSACSEQAHRPAGRVCTASCSLLRRPEMNASSWAS